MLRASRRTIRYAVPPEPDASSSQLLRGAVLDDYDPRDKTSRDYPRKKQVKPARSPQLITATGTDSPGKGTQANEKGSTAFSGTRRFLRYNLTDVDQVQLAAFAGMG